MGSAPLSTEGARLWQGQVIWLAWPVKADQNPWLITLPQVLNLREGIRIRSLKPALTSDLSDPTLAKVTVAGQRRICTGLPLFGPRAGGTPLPFSHTC